MKGEEIKRIKTYVRGLDRLIQNGIPEETVTLIVGLPGTMKSSLAFSILYNNSIHEKIGGLYVSLEQSAPSLIDNMAGLGMKLDKYNELLQILDLGLIRRKLQQMTAQAWIEVFKAYISNLHEKSGFKLLVIDSLPVMEMLAKFKEPREDLFYLFEWLREMKLTTFLIHEMEKNDTAFAKFGEDFLSDGIFHLDLRRDINTVNLFLSVMKLRKTNHRREYYPLIFDTKGFEIVTD